MSSVAQRRVGVCVQVDSGGVDEIVRLMRRPGMAGDAPVRLRHGPDGLHIFDRRTGLNILLDELQTPPAKWAAAPRQVSVALTNACDLRCTHCYAPKSRAVLEESQLRAWLLELDAHGSFGVGFGGGEPTLHPRFVQLVHFAAQETALAVTFTTHAHRLTPELSSDLAGYVDFLRVSVDGVGSTYERVRGRAFSELLRRLSTARAISDFGINVVVNRDTIGDLDRLLEVAIDYQAAELLLLPERGAGRGRDVDNDTSDRLQRWICDALTQRSAIRLAVSAGTCGTIPLAAPLPLEAPLTAYVHITAEGVLKADSFAPDGEAITSRGLMDALTNMRRKGSSEG